MISIVIPVFNEAECVEKHLKRIQNRISSPSLVKEIIVVDGGSNDNTIEKVKSFEDVLIISSPKGRAKQMNFGAKQAKSEILYFLHIDSLPPENFDKYIIESVKKGSDAGCFKMKFRSRHPWLQFIGWLTRFKPRFCRGGDQSLFVTKSLFNKIGGYNEEFLIYEDHEILKHIYKYADFEVIPYWISTSARRFREKGILKLQFLFLMVYFKKWTGATPEELFKFYQKHIDESSKKA
ncbi:TIGR04283 family arsenosugar biosynthesis glycosyltransferase [Psychroflexus aestuariivivens]|uniref:TIGR04283 family arsenosugar biosynthesis glycosyltransferase n=1 Tax=Psychroflexus aestuariivivens TaxID=1795040 RepID=UPI000FDB8A21|nr:TIGR04283 family arsenosugar biosynthesis glycosyltransferase [Psychroflexus aestuariivivens]